MESAVLSGTSVQAPPGRDLSILEELSGRPSKRMHDASLLIEVATEALRMNAEVHYLGSDERLADIRALLQMGGRALRMQDWRLPPLGQLGRRCREAFPEILGDAPLLAAAFGYVCLPVRLTERIVHRPGDKPMLVLIDGVASNHQDVHIALNAISAFCKRSGVTVAIFP
ncbi:MAG: hypothetical protein KGJ23_15395 [Euryarchaeota archaeon]|nr:hypothetical protein [Euryarchaeota archaeon]MDE1837985.1 hypothetical protein [Euryarchaeota archaeon]MDE1881399.1 hypothetical protein [Euryarchaeota archaeon]MDE2046423.1 hypothetical protein [Thermoplasmata archaeon]